MGPTITVILRRILTAGLVAGFIAGTAVTVVQRLQITPLILAAEVFEDAAEAAPAHEHGGAALGDQHHESAPEAWMPANGLERSAFTWLANILAGVGFGLILAAVVAFAGRPVDARRGLLWGLAGYSVFSVAPALGLPPELPGMMAADLVARQVWWIMTVGGTAGGLALMVFAPQPYRRPLQIAGLTLLVLPHLIGAPHLAAEAGTVPAELAARFVVASLAAAALFWAVLGLAIGQVMGRLLPVAAARNESPQPA
jgi:cobalt transporter subunit CbtA